MKISTKGRYGARAVLELALRYGNGPVMVREIAESQGISERYLEKILNTLRTSNLVISTRGAKGGYELAKTPSEITLGDIVRALEGPLDIVACTGETDCVNELTCATQSGWKDVKRAIEFVLDDVNLQELSDRHRELRRHNIIEYII